MMLLGSLVNMLAIFAGCFVGVTLGRFIPERFNSAIEKGIALCVFYIGLDGVLAGSDTLVAILSMVLGVILGELLDLDGRIHALGDWVERRFAKKQSKTSISEGFVNASLLFCVGAMAIMGALDSGLTGDHATLYAKSTLDGITSIVYGSTMGAGVALSGVAVFLYQGLITLCASFIAPFLSEVVIAEMKCVGSLLIIGIFLVGGVVVNNVMSSVENEVGISAFISDDASQSDIDKVEDFIRGIEGVASVDFTTKDQALENFKATSNSDIVDALDGQNPLPASIEVELSDPKLVEDVASQIEQNSTFASICGYDSPSESLKYGQKSVAQLFQLTSYVRYIGIALIVLLIFIALVFINNTIRLAILARRKEIAIMRLVGASNGFIRGPFLMEGSLHAIIGSLFAVGVLELLRNLALPKLAGALKFLAIDVNAGTFAIIYVALVIAGLIIGLFGSALAMRRYLKV